MKTFKVLAMTLVMMFLLCGCTDDKNPSTSNGSGNSAASDSNGSNLGDELESGLSEAGSKVESGISEAGSKIESGLDELNPNKDSNAARANEAVGNMADLSSTKQGWGQGRNKNELNQPIGSLDFQNKYGKYDAFFISPNANKNIYLTFDEGYENGYTAKILDTLKEKKVSAVFFVTYDYVDRNADLVKRMIAEGHIVGNHSYSHVSYPDVSVEEAKADLMKLHDYMKTNFNYDMKLFRFPCGEFSEQTLAMVKECGYKSLFWSYAYKDWDVDNPVGSDEAFKLITENAHDGAIYLLHAVSADNAEVLGRAIDELRKQGFTPAKFDL
ncbi:delta-lactam-biosynthetic de-N-acetylase [Candidatus Soleaferrea massiliensis]|uniref:delta-lactam-biosynthetic de-N-acetylase n=1 Tax=Candidatus Soleaferrea massiliensis TaxID=1470354 RepID=UPI0018CE9BDA|nr:polysaccharide deacetylase family protein [Candidatus Soleaferrea massiliensis]